jgi:hypothetical protein
VTIILRTSERSAFKRCPAKWWWAYREGLKPKGAEKTPLWFGTGVHFAFAEWYLPGTKRGPHPAETFATYAGDALHSIKVADADDETVAAYEDGTSLGITLMEEYVKHYGTDPQWRFIQAEQAFQLDVPWPKERQTLYDVDGIEERMLSYNGTFDGVYQDLATGRIELLETKTAKAVVTTHLTLDDQAGSYWAVASHVLAKAGILKPGQKIAGINYNFVRKAKPDDRPRDAEGYACNKPVKADYVAAIDAERAKMPAPGPSGSWLGPPLTGKESLQMLAVIANKMDIQVIGERSKVQPQPLFTRYMVNRTNAERQTQLRRIQDEAIHMMAIRDGYLPVIKRPTRDCGWDCDFFQMCELQERQGNWKDFRSAAFKQMDPYADHRKSAEE